MAYIDIILLALIALFLVLRLRSTLGEKNEDDNETSSHSKATLKKKPKNTEKIITLDIKRRQKKKPEPKETSLHSFAEKKAVPSLVKLEKEYPSFSSKKFIKNSESAFTLILETFASGDLPKVKNLLNPQLYKQFQDVINERKKASNTTEFSLVRVEGNIINVENKGKKTFITVCFTSEQTNVLYNKAGKAIEGDPKKVEFCEDTWVFEKNMSTASPIWVLKEAL